MRAIGPSLKTTLGVPIFIAFEVLIKDEKIGIKLRLLECKGPTHCSGPR
jgi:hypothetical protein